MEISHISPCWSKRQENENGAAVFNTQQCDIMLIFEVLLGILGNQEYDFSLFVRLRYPPT